MSDCAGFEAVEHTGDLAIRAWATDMSGLIEQAARAMLDLMLEDPPNVARTVELRAEGPEGEDLLIDCLRSILSLIDLEGLVPVTVEVTELEGEEAVCEVGVVPLEEARQALVEDIKAVTYHGLEIRKREGNLEVEIVFDV